jgi:hypothetical protein
MNFAHSNNIALYGIYVIYKMEWQKWNINVLPPYRFNQIEESLEDIYYCVVVHTEDLIYHIFTRICF